MCCSSKHAHSYHADDAVTYPANLNDYCKCLGIDNGTGEWKGATDNVADAGECCGAASGPDGYCDRCRNNCIPKEPATHDGLLPGNVIPAGHEAPLSGIPAEDLPAMWEPADFK